MAVDLERWKPTVYDSQAECWTELESSMPAPSSGSLDVVMRDRTTCSAWKEKHNEEASEGFCAIGIVNAKNPTNNGTLWRSAYQFGAAFTFTVGKLHTTHSGGAHYSDSQARDGKDPKTLTPASAGAMCRNLSIKILVS